MRPFLLTAAIALLLAAPAVAQPLTINFEDGHVSLDATGVPLRTILNEWSRIGGTKVVGADRITGQPITVRLVHVTEAQALETLLRSVAGYMAAPRNNNAGTGPSIYDRILVMATSSTPAVAAGTRPVPGQPNSNAFAGTQRFIPPRQQQRQEQEPEEQDEPDETPPNPPVFTFPPPGQNGAPQPGAFINVPPNPAQPATEQQNIPTSPTYPGQSTTPVGVSRPGMMVPAPQPLPPGVKPPGGN